ncbi:MAG: TonB family protein [Sphingobacteriales bacterium]
MSWWPYLSLVNIYLVLFYVFYALLLRSETFFQLNRIYLISAAALSFFIPMMQAGWIQNLFITQEIKYTVYGSPVMILQLAPVKQAPITIGQILGVVYIAGVVVLFGRLIWQLIVLNRIIKKDEHDSAYSFFNKIKLPDNVKDNSIVSIHEQVHARQWHSADVFIIETVMIINWFNPVVYFYRRAIKHIHEFIADDYATKQAANKAEYAILLLSQTFEVPTHNLVNHFFNHSLLKQRIIMLQKNKSQRVKLLKYGLSAPLFMLMLVLTSATVSTSRAIKVINDKVSHVLLLPPPPISKISNLSAESSRESATRATITKKQQQTAVVSPATATIDTLYKSDSQVFTSVEHAPFFPGGSDAFLNFLAKNIQYPVAMRENNVQGNVIVTFVVEKDGSLSNIRTLKGPGYGANQEAIRVVSLSPKWTPGNQNGRSVRVQYTVPIAFTLANDDEKLNPVPDSGKQTLNLNGKNPLYIVDGKEVNVKDFKINPADIESITVLKDKNAKLMYGDKGANGVIVIVTKWAKQAPTGNGK